MDIGANILNKMLANSLPSHRKEIINHDLVGFYTDNARMTQY